MSLSFQMGQDGFIWWVGVVENTNDPLGSLRAQVRIFGWHDSDTGKISTSDLPWAIPMLPVTQPRATAQYKPGDWVVGFFLDAGLAQQPIIMGVLPAYNLPA